MNDSNVSLSQEGAGAPTNSWLLLLYQLPPKPDYLRVKVRRRLATLGATSLKNAAYVLPNTPDCLEDFQWLRREIVDAGGDASVCTLSLIEGTEDEELMTQARTERDEEYQRVIDQARELGDSATSTDVERLGRRLDEIAARDFFRAPGRQHAERALASLRARLEGGRDGSVGAGAPETATPHGAVWVTRRGVYVDRIASAWLIRRFIDPAATFRFVEPTGYRPAAGEVRFDMFEGEYTHEGDRCTFETLLDRFGLADPALGRIGELVHDIDVKDGKFGHATAAGIAAVLQGLCAAHADDAERLGAGGAVYDALYAGAAAPT